MTLLHYSKTTLMAILLLILGYSHKTLIAQEGRVRYAQTPQIDSAYAKGVSGHMAVLSQGYLLVAGGCNFPDKPALEAHALCWLDTVANSYWEDITFGRRRQV